MRNRRWRDRVGALLLDQPNLWAAGAFYAINVAGIVVLCIHPALQTGTWRTASFSGAALGLVAYGANDLTNPATLRGWPVDAIGIDIAWGIVLTALPATAGCAAARHFA